MKLFFVEGNFTDLALDKSEFKTRLKEHMDYLNQGRAEGWVIMLGPKTDRKGGVMVVKADNLAMVEQYLQRDPFQIHGIQRYRLVEFECDDYDS